MATTPIRTKIREAIEATFTDYASPYFTSYPTVNIKDYDIAGLDEPEYYPVVNILTSEESYVATSIGKSTKDMATFIDVIPWADEISAMEECDKLIEELPNVIFSNPQWSGLAVDTVIEKATLLRLGTDVPSLKVRLKLIIRYRQPRPL